MNKDCGGGGSGEGERERVRGGGKVMRQRPQTTTFKEKNCAEVESNPGSSVFKPSTLITTRPNGLLRVHAARVPHTCHTTKRTREAGFALPLRQHRSCLSAHRHEPGCCHSDTSSSTPACEATAASPSIRDTGSVRLVTPCHSIARHLPPWPPPPSLHRQPQLRFPQDTRCRQPS